MTARSSQGADGDELRGAQHPRPTVSRYMSRTASIRPRASATAARWLGVSLQLCWNRTSASSPQAVVKSMPRMLSRLSAVAVITMTPGGGARLSGTEGGTTVGQMTRSGGQAQDGRGNVRQFRGGSGTSGRTRGGYQGYDLVMAGTSGRQVPGGAVVADRQPDPGRVPVTRRRGSHGVFLSPRG